MQTWAVAGVSWNGHNVFGDSKSVDEVKRLLRVEVRVAKLEAHASRLEILLEVTKEQLNAARNQCTDAS